ncbi:FAD/NAD(P)-binding domain-containing protein [Mycena alexandri]|uniref:FAD/NAD(P)-binding domain-containing protein n=1 Tax=Mycena alexandri TaxID=1745969 RepID=A0AAD6XCP2_9AGAR|nr:FAD/NAD(P)-binding domain-containing protein [Mycena alexandri]
MSKNIVIVGAGIGGGSTVARTLSTKLPSAKITLINPRPYAISLPTLPRMTVSDGNDLFNTALIPFDKLFTKPNGTFVEGVVESIQANKEGGSVVLADGQQFPYDVLVLAPGSHWEGPVEFPIDSTAVPAFLAEQRAQFKKAQKIVLVGGGAVGEKEVTIVHGDTGIMNSTYPAGFRKGLTKSLEARGINVLLGDYVDEIPAPGPTTVKTRKGSVLDADLVVATRGPRPRTEFVAKSLGAATLDERNQIKKQVMKAGAHAAIVSANIIAYLSKRPLKPYKGSFEIIVVTNGKGGGQGYLGFLWGITLGDWFARLVKAKTLLVPMSRGFMGY